MFEGDFINCTLVDPETIICNGTTFKEPEAPLTIHDQLFWIYIGTYCALVLFAGLMSGLTMGLLSLDILSLRVLAEGGKPQEQKYAKRITPIVSRHHLLLVTLLLANAAAVESMPIFLDRVTDPIIAISVSVTAVLLFGEVFPQAICTRHGLAIGATLSPLVILLMVLFFPVAWPISKVLDCLLGKESGTFFRRAELGALVSIHQEKQDQNEEPLTLDEVLIIQGALSMRNKVVEDAHMPLESVFMLDIKSKMDADCIQRVLVKGPYSRLPVYDGERDNIVGILLVKTLLQLDPNITLTVEEIFKKHGRSLPAVPSRMPLYDLLNEMQTGKCHMAAVSSSMMNPSGQSSPDGEDVDSAVSTQGRAIIGIITLEDIIEELLQEEIVDETDEFVDVHRRVRVARAKLARQLSVHQDLGQIEAGVTRKRSPSQEPTRSPRVRSGPIFTIGEINSRPGSQYGSVNSKPDEDTRTSDTSPLINLE
ncbi:DUF21 domain-containing protein At4g14240-like [Asterias rubens]|uniref:DUF21 domain-containing protein At4g14240-like n=1 Tax=Asterias rubens TaxID=7604 RepID=UPI001455ADF5|nr:DUF21 domain-containing protein At4g14240-like [Asterias rubens]